MTLIRKNNYRGLARMGADQEIADVARHRTTELVIAGIGKARPYRRSARTGADRERIDAFV